MKKKRLYTIFFLISVFARPTNPNAAEQKEQLVEKTASVESGNEHARLAAFLGEKLSYTMIYKGLPSARAELRLQRNGDGFDITLTARTRPLFNALFKIDNWYTVTLSADGKMMSVAKHVVQKNIRQDMTIFYDWRQLRAAANPDYEWPILPNCAHLLSMLYNVRLKNVQPGELLSYILDVESQLWQINGVVTQAPENPGERQIIFRFTPVLPIHRRAWRTDLLTNRLAHMDSQLIIRLGPPPQNVPRLISFGGKENRVEMKLGD
jgi:hypothetical protein